MSYLALKRTTGQPIAINPDAGTVTDIGAVISGVDTSSSFPDMCRNHCTLFRGEYYFMVRVASTSGYRLAKFDGTNFVYTPILYTPGASESVNSIGLATCSDGTDEVLVAMLDVIDNSGFTRKATALRSLDGSAFTVSQSANLGYALSFPDPNGILTYYNQYLIYSFSDKGMHFYDPIADTFAVAGALLATNGLNNASWGCFVRFFGRLLLFTLDTSSGLTLKLFAWNPDNDVTLSTVAAADQWLDAAPTGLPSSPTISLDGNFLQVYGGCVCAFTDNNNGLYLFMSVGSGLKLWKTTKSTYPAFTDVTAEYIPASISTLPRAKIQQLGDDVKQSVRRALFYIIDDTVTDEYYVSWDFETPMQVLMTQNIAPIIAPATEQGLFQIFNESGGDTRVYDVTFTEVAAGNYKITYTLSNSLSRQSDVAIYYTLDNVNWLVATDGEAYDGLTDLSTSPSGVTYEFDWLAMQDFSIDKVLGVKIVATVRSI